jgi:acid phosphatase family membrane protein YuiD
LDIAENFWLVSAISAWFVAQFLKVLTGLFRDRSFDLLTLMFATGGMPSSHTAVVCATAFSCGILHGYDSAIFAVAAELLGIQYVVKPCAFFIFHTSPPLRKCRSA